MPQTTAALLILLSSASLCACLATDQGDVVPVDLAKFERATVVLEITGLGFSEGSKYHWTEVTPGRVLKNESDVTFDDVFRVANRCDRSGPTPPVLYLEPYGDPAQGLFRLLDGGDELPRD